MECIKQESELLTNIETLRQYLKGSGVDQDFAKELISAGICFVVTGGSEGSFFAPSRFVGYRANTRHDHLHNEEKDGRVTNAVLEELLRESPTSSEALEREYETWCSMKAIEVRRAPFGIARKFWDLRQRVG